MLNRGRGRLHQCGGIVEGDKVRLLDVKGNSQWHKTSGPYSYASEDVTYISNDGVLTVSFDAECDIAIVTRVK